jgi:hypothetical protein
MKCTIKKCQQHLDHAGKVLHMTQQAYIESTNNYGVEEVFYLAHAVDDDGNDYLIRWETPFSAVPQTEWPEDESEMCDWDSFSVKQVTTA